MSFKFNSDKEQIRANAPQIIGDQEISIRSGTGTDEKEVLRALLEPSTKTPRIGINRTGNRIDRIEVNNPGSGYTTQPTVTVSAPQGENPIQAAASASLSAEGRLAGVLIDNVGAGYTSPPIITITGGNGVGATATAYLDSVDYELDINGAIRTSTSIISDTARILNLDIDNLVTPDAAYRAPNLKTFMNNTGAPWAPERLLQKDTFVYRGANVYQSMNVGTTSVDPVDPPLHTDGIEINGNPLDNAVPGVQFKHIGFRVSDPNEVFYNTSGESGVYPRSITPLLGDSSDKIATTEYVLNLATNDVGGRIYVSQLIGDDNNDGRSPVNPVRTIKKACQLAWETPGVKESIIVAGGDYTEDNPMSLPPDASIVGDNLRLVIIRPANPRKHIVKFGDKNYVVGVTYRDQEGADTFTWDYAMVFDDKQRVTYDFDQNGDATTVFPVGHQVFGDSIFRTTFQSNGGLNNLVASIELRGVNAGGIVTSRNVQFNEVTGPSAYVNGKFDFVQTSGSVNAGETLVFAGANSERFQPSTAYTVGTVVWTEDHVYNVTVAGTSGENNPTHDTGAANNGSGALEFTYLRDTYSLVTTDIISIRPEGEVVFENRPNLTDPPLPISRIDFSQQGQAAIATGGFGDYGTPEDLGGIVFYTNPLIESDNIHDFKEGEEILIENLSTNSPDLSMLNGKQKIYKVIEDPDGRSRRFVIPKKLPSLTNDNYDPGQFAQVKSYSKSVTLSLLNSPFKFGEATPISRRYQDAALQIKNNREFIADEVVGRITDEFSKDYYSVSEIGGTATSTTTPTSATYNAATGDLVFTKVNHGFDVGTGISIADNSLTFTCLMDNNATEHNYPRSGDPGSGRALPITTKTDDTFTVNVGISPANADFTAQSGTSYNPATGDLVLEIGSHSIPVGGSVTIDSESLSFTCDMDNRDTAKQYPRVGIDPYAVRSIPVTSSTTTSITVNIGAAPADKYFQPTYAEYDPTTGDMVFTIGQHGLGVGRNITIDNDSLTFTCLQDPSAAKTYPRSGIDPYSDSKSIAITSVGASLHTPTDAPYNASNGEITFTVNDHGFLEGDYVKIADNSLTYSCAVGGNYTHQFVSAVGGAVTSGGTYTHTFISAVANGVTSNAGNLPNPVINVAYTPSTGNMVITSNGHNLTTGNTLTIADNALKFTCSMDNNATEHSYPRPSDPVSGQTISITGTSTNTITVNVGASPAVSHDVSDATYDPYTGELALTIGSHSLVGQTVATPTTGTTYNPTTGIMSITTTTNHGFVNGDKVKLDDGAVKFSCDYGAGNHNYVGGTAAGAVTAVGGAIFDVTNASYTPTTGVLELTIGSHSLTTSNQVIVSPASLDFQCDADGYNTTHSYPRPTDPVAGEAIDITAVTGTTITVNVGVSSTGTSYPRGPKNHTVANATYDPTGGNMVLTIGAHGLQVGDDIKLDPNSLTFECPAAVGTHAFVTGAPSAITANVGGPFTATTGTSYNPTTGEMVLEIGSHSLTTANTIQIATAGLTFTCDADNNATNHQYPRATDPVAGENIAITATSATTITVNVGVASSTNQSSYPRATGAATSNGADYAYDNELTISAITGDSITVNVNGGQGAVSINSVHTFVSATPNGVKTGGDPISGKWITISNVTSNTFDIQVLDTVPSTNTNTHTFISGLSNGVTKKGSAVRLSPNSLRFTCDKDGNASQHDYPRATDPAYNTSLDIVGTSGTTITLNVGKADVGSSYPRPGFDPISGRWIPIEVIDVNTFKIDVGSSSYTGTHTFVSAAENAIARQDGTITINVGVSSNTTVHSFVSATANAIRYEPQSTHYFEGSAADAVKFRPQTAHTFVRSANGNLSTGGSSFKIFLGASSFSHTYVSGGTVKFGGVTYTVTNFVYDNLITGNATITVNTSIPGIAEDSIIEIADILVECTILGVTTQKKYPSLSIPISDETCKRDIRHFLNALVQDLEFGSNNNIIDGAKKYIDATNTYIDETIDFEIIQTVRAIEYARELATYAMRKWRTGNGTVSDPVYTPVYSSLDRYFDPTIIDDTTPSGACINVQSSIDTLSYLFVDVLANNASGTVIDAAYLIARNRDHIVDEAYNDARNAFPSLVLNNVDERKCRRDINLVISALLKDLVLGGNDGTVTYAELYFTGTLLTGVPASELPATRYAFTKTRDLCIEAIRNWNDASGNPTTSSFTPIPRVTDNTILADPAGNPLCASTAASITTLFGLLDDILSGTIVPGATTKNKGSLLDTAGLYNYADSIITDFNGNKITVKATYDDYPIIEASPYTQNSSVISKLGGGGALVDGAKVKQPNCPFPGLNLDGTAKFPNQGKSMVASAFTIVSEGGTGYKIINDGYVQLVSVFCIFTADGILAESGGYASVTNSASNFGIYSLRARGFSQTPYIFDMCTVTNVSSTPTGRTIFTVSGLGREPLEHYIVKIDGFENVNPEIEYFVDTVEGVTVGPPFSAQLTLESGSGGPAEFKNSTTDAVVSLASLIGESLKLHRPSIVNSSSHTWEYCGSGTSYLALPENGGTKIEANEQVSEDYGRTYVSGTDELGDFKVGTFARIENRTGNITFTGTVTISEVEFLKLKGGDVVVTGFDNSNTLGGANSSDSKLPTQKAVKDFITNALGPYINKPFSTNPVPRALVELTDSGKISEDQIPPLRPFQVYTIANQNERLAIEGALAGDIAIQQDTTTSYILNNDNESLFTSFAVDPTLQFTINDVFTGSISGGKIQATEYRQGAVYQINITDGGSGYITPPVVTVSGGNPQAGAVDANITTTIANGQVVIMTIQLFNGYVGGKGYTTPPTITIAAPAGSGTQATATALIESRLYGDIVNNIKIVDTDTILSSDLPAETININRVINTSADNNNNWVSLSTNQIAASDITSGVISTARLASNAAGAESAANSFTFLRGDQSYAAAVQTVKGPETRYFAQLKIQANSGASQLIFDSSSNFLKGHEVDQITGIQADTNIDGVLTESGETTITLDKFLTATLPAGTVLEFNRGKSPLTVESSQTEGGFVEEVVIQSGGSGFTDGQYFNLPLTGGAGTGLRVNIVVGSGSVTDCTIVSGGQDYGQNTSQSNVDFVISSAPAEIGGGTGLNLLGKVTTVLRQYANVTIDVDRVSDLTTSGDPYGTLGVSRFYKQQFLIGQAGNGSVQINTGPDSGLDADTLDGAQGTFYLNSGNQNAGTLPVERLSGTYNINIANQSGSTLRLKTSTNSPTGNPSPDEFAAGIIADTKNNSADGLADGGSRHVVMTIRNGGTDFDATFGGVRQLAFTDANADVGAGLWLRGSFNSPANSFGNWHEIWHSGNDGTLSGLDADKMDGRQGTWYQSAQHTDYGVFSNERLPNLQREKDFLSKIRVMDWSGNVRVNVLVRDELLSTTPFVAGQSVNLYTAGGVARGSISITKVEPNQDVNDAANNYTLITGSLTNGDYTSFDDAEFIGTGGVGNAFQFQNWNISQVDDNADGDIDGTYEVISGESVSGNARLRLGRKDGTASDPSIFFRSSSLTPSDYNSAIIATGGGSTNGSGTLEVKVGNNNSFTVNGNKIWNEGNIAFNSSNVAGTGVIRDANGDFSAGTITASLTGSASNNVLRAGDTMSGALVIGGVVAANQALSVSGRADFLSNITVTADLAVDTKVLFVDASENKVGIGETDFTNKTGQSFVKLRIRPSIHNGYESNHTIDFGQFNGNWVDGSSGADSQFGMSFSWQDSVRGGILYDHRSSERMAIWSSYGRLAFMVDPGTSGNEVPITVGTEAMTIIKEGTIGINVTNPSNSYKLDVNGQSRFRDFITLDDAGDNSGTGLYFLGATGGADGSGGYLSNFRVGNSLIGSDIFEITANDGPSGATTWKSTPAIAVQGTNNRVAINSTTFAANGINMALTVGGNFNFTGEIYKNGNAFVTSRWTAAPNGTDIYRGTKVGINTGNSNPSEALDVSGSIYLTGTLKANGQEQWSDSYGTLKAQRTTIASSESIGNNQLVYSVGPITINSGSTVTIGSNSFWAIL
jgi:hypothetical protein